MPQRKDAQDFSYLLVTIFKMHPDLDSSSNIHGQREHCLFLLCASNVDFRMLCAKASLAQNDSVCGCSWIAGFVSLVRIWYFYTFDMKKTQEGQKYFYNIHDWSVEGLFGQNGEHSFFTVSAFGVHVYVHGLLALDISLLGRNNRDISLHTLIGWCPSLMPVRDEILQWTWHKALARGHPISQMRGASWSHRQGFCNWQLLCKICQCCFFIRTLILSCDPHSRMRISLSTNIKWPVKPSSDVHFWIVLIYLLFDLMWSNDSNVNHICSVSAGPWTDCTCFL